MMCFWQETFVLLILINVQIISCSCKYFKQYSFLMYLPHLICCSQKSLHWKWFCCFICLLNQTIIMSTSTTSLTTSDTPDISAVTLHWEMPAYEEWVLVNWYLAVHVFCTLFLFKLPYILVQKLHFSKLPLVINVQQFSLLLVKGS